MRKGWREVPLGTLIERRRDFTAVEPEGEYVILGVQRSGWGFVKREPIKGSDQKFTKLLRVETDDLVYRTITAFEAPAAVATEDEAGLFVTPQTFPVFRIDRKALLPGYMSLITTWPSFHEAMASRCTGTVLRRKTLSVSAFGSIPIPLPPLAEQRRIVDLIGALDDTIAAAENQGTLAEQALAQARDVLPEGKPTQLADVLTSIDSGVSTKPVVGDGPRQHLLTLAAIRPGVFHPEATKDVGAAGLPERARLREGDLLITRSNTPDRVGYVARARGVQADVFIPDLVWRLVPDETRISADYLAHLLSSPTFRSVITGVATGTSQSMRKINKRSFSSIRIPLPSTEAQATYVEPLASLAKTVALAEQSVQRLTALRSNLLTALLSGEHEIPETYDEFIEEVA